MANKNNDYLIGKKINMLTVIQKGTPYIRPNKSKVNRYLCLCECGAYSNIPSCELKNKKRISCGCMSHKNNLKHGDSINNKRTRLNSIYTGMKTRCYNKNSFKYKNYGARGIVICNKWIDDYNEFKTWSLNNGYNDNLTIERINVNGNYEPENCKWATIKEQENNRTNNHLIKYNNEIHNIKEWSDILNINYHVLYMKLSKTNWSMTKIFLNEVNKYVN